MQGKFYDVVSRLEIAEKIIETNDKNDANDKNDEIKTNIQNNNIDAINNCGHDKNGDNCVSDINNVIRDI